jgi:serine/threonine protein kinase
MWACGVLLYKIVCGQPPFQGNDQEELKNNILKGSLSFSEPIWRSISIPTKEIIS